MLHPAVGSILLATFYTVIAIGPPCCCLLDMASTCSYACAMSGAQQTRNVRTWADVLVQHFIPSVAHRPVDLQATDEMANMAGFMARGMETHMGHSSSKWWQQRKPCSSTHQQTVEGEARTPGLGRRDMCGACG